MATRVTRKGDAGQNFTQVAEGELPNSVEISLNAKGQAQLTVKLYFTTPDEMVRQADGYVASIIGQVRATLAAMNIPLAGQEGK